MKKNAAAFTLLEILFVTLTIAILAAIGSFAYVNSYRQSVMKNTNDSLVSLLHLAQQKAVAQEGGNAWGVYVNNTSVPAIVSLYGGNAYATSTVAQTFEIPYQLSLTAPASGQTSDFNFQKFSGIPTASGTIVVKLNASTETKTITVTSQGGISSN